MLRSGVDRRRSGRARGTMFRRAAAIGLAGVVLGVGGSSSAASKPLGSAHLLCSAGYVDATIGGEQKCLRAGEFCSPSHEADYGRYGFACVAGHLKRGAPSTATSAATPLLGRTVPLARRSQVSGCTRGALPDRQCSPGADYSGLTQAVLCSTTFRTGTIRNVPDSEKHQVEIEYGMVPEELRPHDRDRPHRLAWRSAVPTTSPTSTPSRVPGRRATTSRTSSRTGSTSSSAPER